MLGSKAPYCKVSGKATPDHSDPTLSPKISPLQTANLITTFLNGVQRNLRGARSASPCDSHHLARQGKRLLLHMS